MFSASVTTFHQWPPDTAGQSWRLADPSGGQNRLEHAAYADLLRAALLATEMIEASEGQTARFTVSLHYRSEATHIIRREPADPFFYGNWGRPWGWGGYYTPTWFTVTQDAWRYVLTVTIHDSLQDNAEVYRASAISVSSENDLLPQAMPHLMRAIFEAFPGNNGAVRTVRYRHQ